MRLSTRILFGRPGNWIERHPLVAIPAIFILISISDFVLGLV